MDKNTVIKAREYLRQTKDGKSFPIKVICDNSLVLYESLEGGFLVWDDDNERIISIVPASEIPEVSALRSVEIMVVPYEFIQYMSTAVQPNRKVLDEFLSQYVASGKAADWQVKHVIDTLDSRFATESRTIDY